VVFITSNLFSSTHRNSKREATRNKFCQSQISVLEFLPNLVFARKIVDSTQYRQSLALRLFSHNVRNYHVIAEPAMFLTSSSRPI
jgi:hypothetical protein